MIVAIYRSQRSSELFCHYLNIFTNLITYLLFSSSGLTYSEAGVDIIEGERLVESIKEIAASTSRLGCTAALGGFGGVFDMSDVHYSDPLLVSGTDGVGTKLKVD